MMQLLSPLVSFDTLLLLSDRRLSFYLRMLLFYLMLLFFLSLAVVDVGNDF